jgi:hypothetical protein
MVSVTTSRSRLVDRRSFPMRRKMCLIVYPSKRSYLNRPGFPKGSSVW